MLKSSIRLMKHQLLALRYLQSNDSFMLCMEQGTGKTLPSLVHMANLIRTGKIRTCLVVCPKSVIASWKRDIEFFDDESQEQLNTHVTVINYDSVWRGKFNRVWDLILIDEGHSIANHASKRSKWLLNYSNMAKYHYILTGTPINNGRLEDSWSLLAFLYPYKAPRSMGCTKWSMYTGGYGTYADWINRYAALNQFYKPYKYYHISEVQKVINSTSFTIKKKDCMDLPSKLPDEIRYLELENKKVYKTIVKDSISPEGDLLENPLAKLVYLRQYLSRSKFKAEALNDLLDELGDEKLVVFFQFRESEKAIIEVLKKRKTKFLNLDGSSKDHECWRTFNNDKSIQVFVVQYESGCQGIDLFSAHCTCYYEPTLRSVVLEQSRDRTHRKGQQEKCSYVHFITKGSIENHIYSQLAKYKDFTNKLANEYMESCYR